MASTLNVSLILKHLTEKQKTGIVPFREFCDYIYRYVQRHIEESPDLLGYMSNTQAALQKDLDELENTGEIVWISSSEDKKFIGVVAYYISSYASIYNDIKDNPSIPYPILTDLPKRIPKTIVNIQNAADFIASHLENEILSDEILYALEFPRSVTPILFPSSVPISLLVEEALVKIRQLLLKEESHDYFLKKIKVANQGKDLSISTFFDRFIQNPKEYIASLQGTGDSFYYWSQLCFYIKQDYEKVQDYTVSDMSILHSVYISEYATSFYKNQAQKTLQRDVALKTLESSFLKPPYYFSYIDITKFLDARGIPLLGQYTEEELKDYMHTITTEAPEGMLPKILVFKTDSDQRYYINKDKVIPLIVRLCSDARIAVRDELTKKWTNALKKFDTLPEMKNQNDFEKSLEQEVDVSNPVLYALLNSPYLPSLYYETLEKQEPSEHNILLFINGSLINYSELLMINRAELLADIKILLPFWYTIPAFAFIMSLFMRKPRKKNVVKKSAKERIIEKEQKNEAIAMEAKEDVAIAKAANKSHPKMSKAKELRAAAQYAETQLVPASSSLDRELASYIHEWNQIIDKKASENLVEDINSLIRDYIRKILRTMSGSGFTLERIKNLAETLVKTPGMQKIHNHDALFMYTQLYIVKIVKNIPG